MLFEQVLPDLLASIPASVYCKGRKGEYLEVNKLFLYCTEATRESEALGKTDRDLLWGEQADFLMRNDQEVMVTGKAKIAVESCHSFGKVMRVYLSHKMPLLDREGKITGVVGLSFLLANAKTVYRWLRNAGMIVSSEQIEQLITVSEKAVLTRKESDILRLVLRGRSAREIGDIIHRSPRTVEHHIENIKNKSGISSKADLIDMFFDSDL
jgi:DNA-binding CsgD family transcriptional regulator